MLQFNLFELISALFIGEALIYIAFLISIPKSKPNRLLALFLGLIVLLMVNLFIHRRWPDGTTYFYYELLAMLAAVQLLYVKSIVYQQTKVDFRHLWGGVLVFAIRIIFYLIGGEFNEDLFEIWLSLPLLIYVYRYLFLGVKHLRRHDQALLATQSNYALYNLKWLQYELIALGVLFGTLGIEALSLFWDLGSLYEYVVLLPFLSILVFVNVLIFKSLKLPFLGSGVSEVSLGLLEIAEKKYKGSSITREESARLFVSLQTVMEQEKVYKEFDLNLSELATMTKMSAPVLSQVINENAKLNFNDFVNGYRVEEAKRLLSQKELLIKEVMFDSGFQSTSTFNHAFKKATGKSPSVFQKSLQNVQK